MHPTERLLADFVRATMDSLKPKSQRPQDAVSCSDCLNAVIWCMCTSYVGVFALLCIGTQL